MTKRVRRPNVTKGTLVPLGNGFSLAVGKHPEKTDDIDIGPNNKNGLSVNHGEILQNTGNSVRVFSAEPILGGKSPAQLLYGGANPNAVFAAQEHWKDVHKMNDDGTRQAKYGKRILRKVKNKLNSLTNNSNSLLNKLNILPPVKEGEEEKNQGINWSGIKTTNNRSYDSNYIDYINKGLVSRGVGKNQRAAIIANIIEESGGNPFAVDSTKKFKGLLQWEESRYWPGDEKDVYKEIDNQLDYIVNTAGNATDRKSWTHGGKGSGYNSLTDAMAAYNSEDDLEAAMRGYTLGYVRPAGGINSYNNRLKVAQQLSALEGFAFGGQITKQSLGERPNAKFGKEMKNKKKPLYPNADVTYKLSNGSLTSIKAGKLEGKQMPQGTIISQATNGLPGTPNGTPINRKPSTAYRSYQRTIKYGETPEKNDTTYRVNNPLGLGLVDPKEGFNADYYEKMKMGGRRKGLLGIPPPGAEGSYYDKDGNPLFDTDIVPAVATAYRPLKSPKAELDPSLFKIAKPEDFKGLNADLTPIKPVVDGSVKNSGKFGQFLNSATGADITGSLINAAGTIATNIINNKYIDSIKFTPKEAVHYNPVKLKTKINIAPQIAQMKEMRARLQDAAVKTSGSSRNAYQKILAGHNSLLESAMNLYGQKENQETQLINQDRLNQQSVAHKNAKEFIDTLNYNLAGKDNLENTKSQLRASNAVSTINNLAGIINGPNGLLARKEARKSLAANLAVMAAAHPDAIKLMQGEQWNKRLSGISEMLEHNYWG